MAEGPDLSLGRAKFPAEPTLRELSYALDSIVNWFVLGVNLGLGDYQLRPIEKDYHGDAARCKIEMLNCWLQNAALPTWKAITDALQQMGEHTVAAKIQAKYYSSSTDTAAATPTLKELSNVLGSIVDWYLLGVKLGLEDHELSTIELNYHGDSERCKLEMMSRWLRSAKLPTWKAVADALHLMEEHRVALEIREKYYNSSTVADVGSQSAMSPQSPCTVAIVDHNNRKIKGKFAMLITITLRSLQKRMISVKDVQVFLIAMCSSPNSRDRSNMVLTDIESARTLDEIFRALSKCKLWDYLNYHLLQSIIEQFANDDGELNGMMEHYQQDLTGYVLTQRIQRYLDSTTYELPLVTVSDSENPADEIIPSQQTHKLFRALTTVIEANVTEHTLSYVQTLWVSLSKQFPLPSLKVILHGMTKGYINPMETEPPLPETEPPLPETELPPLETEPPLLETEPPLPETDPPLPETEPPPLETEPPLPETEPPLPETEPPLPETEPPLLETEPPLLETEPPLLETEPPLLETEPPLLKTEPPLPDTEPPQLETEPPLLETEPPLLETEPPLLETEPPLLETEPPLLEIEPPLLKTEPPQLRTEPLLLETEPQTEPPLLETKPPTSLPLLESEPQIIALKRRKVEGSTEGSISLDLPASENEATSPNMPLRKLPQQLNPGDLAFLMDHLQPIASHWRAVGLQLGLLPWELDNIAATPLLIPGAPAAYFQEVLSKWLERAPPFRTLCNALRSRSVDQMWIALELEQQYQTYKTARRWDEDPELSPFVKKAEPTGMQLGAGAYGSVERVKIEGAMYAAKRFTVKICMNPDEFYKKFFSEFRILFGLRHSNIVQYQGVSFLPDSQLPALVMEQLQTNLHNYLLNHSYANLPLKTKLSILQDVARGLAYLHNHKPAVIHRDLSAKNVLLSSEMVAKISDFGNSRIVDIDPALSSEFKSTTHVPGTIIYMPPEACSGHAKFNDKLDIFSFGHLALFTVTQVFPCDLLPVYDDDNSCYRSEVERRHRYIDQLEEQLGGDHDLTKLIKQCLQNSPKMRPTANDIVCTLEQLVASSQTWCIQ